MSAKQHLKHLLFRLVGKQPEAVIVQFATGPEDKVRRMAEEVRGLIPDRRHFLVSVGAPIHVEGATPVTLRPAGALGLYAQLWRALRPYRIGAAPVMLGFPAHAALRRAALWTAPRKILAYNPNLERHHLQVSKPIASLLFLAGVPLDRIYLRPSWLAWSTHERTTVPDDPLVLEGRKPSKDRRAIAVLTPFSPYPLSHGGAVRLYNLLREMSKEFDVYLFFFRENETAATLLPLLDFLAAVAMVTKPRYREPRWASIEPPEVREYESMPMRRLIDRLIPERNIDALQIEYTQLANYRGDILVEHDVTFDLYSQIHARERTLSSWWNLWRWKRYEKRAVRRFHRIVTMSPKDAQLLGVRHARVIANGVDLQRFQPSEETAGHRLLFIGSFRHFPNVTAFLFFLNEVWPLVRSANPDATVDVVAGPNPELYWNGKLPDDGRIRLHGFVPDVRPLYQACNVVLVPTLVSAGTNVKVLEAMAMGRAIVTTTSGVGGIPVEHGKHVWIADAPDAFAEGIHRCLLSSSYRARLAAASRKLVEDHFDWSRLGEMQRALIREVLPGGILVRAGAETDLPAVRRIQAEALPSSRWEPAHYLQHEFYVAENAGVITGFLVARRTAPDEKEILNLAVSEQFRGQGVGEKLLRRLLAAEPCDVILEVRESNAVARRLYERVGFANAGLRPNYYEDPPETAVIMRAPYRP